MESVQNSKVIQTNDTQITTAETIALTIDRKGFNYAQVCVYSASTAAPTVLKVEEGDTTTAYATFSPFVGGTDFTLPTVSADECVADFGIDCRARKRYLKVSMTPAASSSCYVNARLLNSYNEADSADDKNVGVAVNG